MSSKLKKIQKGDKDYLFQNYGERLPVAFVSGKNSILFDQDKNKYIDFFSGIAVSNLGHNNKDIIKAAIDQIKNIIHTSNWFLNNEQIDAAKALQSVSFPGKTLWVNSGTEANEAAIKLARRYGLSKSKKLYNIITFNNSFHGRTYGSMSATAQQKIHGGVGPVVNGFIYLPLNDIKQFKKHIKKNVVAVMVELIQGEGGINIINNDFLQEVYAICNEKDILLVIDEVQTGVGRTGLPFAYQHFNVIPDIMTLAKGLGAGFPIGALHAKSFLAEFFPGGSHGTTFGGNHVTCAVAEVVLKELKKNTLQKNVMKVSKFILETITNLSKEISIIKDVRGMGLHIGIELSIPGMDIVKKALASGLIINCTAGNVIRIMHPLNIDMNTVKVGMKIFESILKSEDMKSENS